MTSFCISEEKKENVNDQKKEEKKYENLENEKEKKM